MLRSRKIIVVLQLIKELIVIPFYFDIWLEEEPLSLFFEVSSQLIEFCQEQSEYYLEQFAGGFSTTIDYFGRNQLIVVEERNSEAWRLKAVIPSGLSCNCDLCGTCHGSKIDEQRFEDFGDKRSCRDCKGTGLNIEATGLPRQLTRDIALLTSLVDSLSSVIKVPLANNRPMALFILSADGGYNRQNIHGIYTKYLDGYLEDLSLGESKKLTQELISSQMMKVYNLTTTGKAEKYTDYFPCSIKQKYFSIQVPGENGCNVYTCSINGGIFPYNPDKEKFFSLGCHNIDSADQQLALIAGLAYLRTLSKVYYYSLESIKYRSYLLSRVAKAMA